MAGPAHHRSLPVVFLPGQKDERVLAARWPRASPAPACRSPTTPWPSMETPRKPRPLSHSPSPSSPSLSLSHARDRTQLSPPTSSPTATAISEPLRRAPELRRDAPVLSAEPHDAGRPGAPSLMPSPSSAPMIAALRFAASDASPTPLGFSASPL